MTLASPRGAATRWLRPVRALLALGAAAVTAAAAAAPWTLTGTLGTHDPNIYKRVGRHSCNATPKRT